MIGRGKARELGEGLVDLEEAKIAVVEPNGQGAFGHDGVEELSSRTSLAKAVVFRRHRLLCTRGATLRFDGTTWESQQSNAYGATCTQVEVIIGSLGR
jgi:hypothetical protein